MVGLSVLKVYGPNETVHAAIFNFPSLPTLRKYTWFMVEKLAHLQSDEHGIIVFDQRFPNDV